MIDHNPSQTNKFKPQPTIGRSDDVDEGARLFFENWLPLRWKKRKQVPDIHIDYRVEMVNEGEPSGLHFQAQIKGRSIYKRKAKKLAEPFKTKHLRYYLRCEEPVFLFLIDPVSKSGHWTFIQRYLREHVKESLIGSQKTVAIQFDALAACDDWANFEEDLKKAWIYMRELHPGSPTAAILAEKMRLERLDPRFRVQIEATQESKRIQVQPLIPLTKGPSLRMLSDSGAERLREFNEKGHSFRVKADEIEVDGSPIHNAIFRELGATEITITNGMRFKGCLQFLFQGDAKHTMLQIEGEWQLAPKKIVFHGQLSEAPLKVEFSREKGTSGAAEKAEIIFRLDWEAWEQQALLSLAYFLDLKKFAQSDEFCVRSLIRGNELWKAEQFTMPTEARGKVIKAIDWLEKCQAAARHLLINPPFPKRGQIRDVESDDMQLIIKLIEAGKHEQANVGQVSVIESDMPDSIEPLPKEALRIEFPEAGRLVRFFGTEIQIGPLMNIWTNMRLTSVTRLKGNRFKFKWRGGSESVYTIEYRFTSSQTPASRPSSPQ